MSDYESEFEKWKLPTTTTKSFLGLRYLVTRSQKLCIPRSPTKSNNSCLSTNVNTSKTNKNEHQICIKEWNFFLPLRFLNESEKAIKIMIKARFDLLKFKIVAEGYTFKKNIGSKNILCVYGWTGNHKMWINERIANVLE